MGSSNSAPALGGMSPELLALLMTQQQGIGGTGASIGAAPTGGTTGFIETAANPFGGASGVEFTSDGEIGGKGLLNMLKGIFM
jgi:hypothetical protein